MARLDSAVINRERARKVVVVCTSIILALFASEQFASFVRGGAFPYLNIFEADGEFGVVLRPNTDTAVRSFEGRITEVSTNVQGFRGPDWSRTESRTESRALRRVLLLGDSQVFGYNVSFDDTLAAHLTNSDTTVFNAAVPSWGPSEYVAALERLAIEHRPTHVVFVANVANDWFESEVPNRLRTTAQDGWAVSQHASRRAPREFPGRAFLMGRSHLVYAARKIVSHVAGPTTPRVSTIDELQRRMDELTRSGQRRSGHSAHRSRITRHLLAAQSVCEQHGCRLVAAALPIDVQVYSGEWAKYRSAPRDLRSTERLGTDFVAEAREHGVAAVNLLGPLRSASPGAFLSDDYHLSGRGHHAVAAAIESLVGPTRPTADHQAALHPELP